MRVLHVMKTSEGGIWAAKQAAELVKQGVDVHVAVPGQWGAAMGDWHRSGARLHVCQLDLPVRSPWKIGSTCAAARKLVDQVQPDLIHSHFVGTTVLLRLALGKGHPIPRLFQVAGPLHMEHAASRSLDLATAGPKDLWIGTSRFVVEKYMTAGVQPGRVFLSYHGGSASDVSAVRNLALRRRLGIADNQFVVGNANYMYPPKAYLGQKTGIKCHEQVIEAMRLILRKRSDVVGLLIGGVFGKDRSYESKLRALAQAAGGNRIFMPGYMRGAEIAASWADFDCAMHVPLSENCGGVLEPLLASVPVVAAAVGGLPEIIRDGVTGTTVSGSNPAELAAAVLHVLDRLREYRALAANGRALVRDMFDVRRTASEVLGIYRHALDSACPRPAEFDAASALERLVCKTPVTKARQRTA